MRTIAAAVLTAALTLSLVVEVPLAYGDFHEVSGIWIDNFGIVWALKNLLDTVNGNAHIGSCFWLVSGRLDRIAHTFIFLATTEIPGCVPWIEYSGHATSISSYGVWLAAAGTFVNSNGFSGSFAMHRIRVPA